MTELGKYFVYRLMKFPSSVSGLPSTLTFSMSLTSGYLYQAPHTAQNARLDSKSIDSQYPIYPGKDVFHARIG